ncbi:hypothetical protein VP01_2544g2 [Puccinia sorghi]|uniref:Uncharacterized protein n=1 Tax=Puccinia sorghi TaxID=27349 RepID=A0A0L6V596_9BASI|nr:hypothetical protein VP01_2544g2 [Puccinia sorghi]
MWGWLHDNYFKLGVQTPWTGIQAFLQLKSHWSIPINFYQAGPHRPHSNTPLTFLVAPLSKNVCNKIPPTFIKKKTLLKHIRKTASKTKLVYIIFLKMLGSVSFSFLPDKVLFFYSFLFLIFMKYFSPMSWWGNGLTHSVSSSVGLGIYHLKASALSLFLCRSPLPVSVPHEVSARIVVVEQWLLERLTDDFQMGNMKNRIYKKLTKQYERGSKRQTRMQGQEAGNILHDKKREWVGRAPGCLTTGPTLLSATPPALLRPYDASSTYSLTSGGLHSRDTNALNHTHTHMHTTDGPTLTKISLFFCEKKRVFTFIFSGCIYIYIYIYIIDDDEDDDDNIDYSLNICIYIYIYKMKDGKRIRMSMYMDLYGRMGVCGGGGEVRKYKYLKQDFLWGVETKTNKKRAKESKRDEQRGSFEVRGTRGRGRERVKSRVKMVKMNEMMVEDRRGRMGRGRMMIDARMSRERVGDGGDGNESSVGRVEDLVMVGEMMTKRGRQEAMGVHGVVVRMVDLRGLVKEEGMVAMLHERERGRSSGSGSGSRSGDGGILLMEMMKERVGGGPGGEVLRAPTERTSKPKTLRRLVRPSRRRRRRRARQPRRRLRSACRIPSTSWGSSAASSGATHGVVVAAVGCGRDV